jgi:hypothetical protein
VIVEMILYADLDGLIIIDIGELHFPLHRFHSEGFVQPQEPYGEGHPSQPFH